VKIVQYLSVFFDFDNYSQKTSILSASRLVSSLEAMEIIIDGYNVIGSETGLTGNLERKRNFLVQQLVNYHKNKGHGLTVVFDGWRSRVD
jgi:YacP-like NYN domain